MTNTDQTDQSNTEKSPDDWTTGEEPLTGAQRSYIETLSGEAAAEVPDFDKMTKSEASKLIEELQVKTGRGN